MKEMFLNEKPVMALVIIRKTRGEIYGSIVSKKIDTTYAHTVKIISELEEEGLVKSEKKGRKKILHLTEEGKEYADLFIELLNKFDGSDAFGGDAISEEKGSKLREQDIQG